VPRDPKKKVHKDFNEGIYHRPPTGPSFLAVGVVVAILLLIASYFAFTKSLPFGSAYEVTASFENAPSLRATSPVRIAGVNVGEVTGVELDGEVAKVSFELNEEGRPLKEDAEVNIRPRLFLEGNYFLDLRPGSPSAAELPDGGNIPVTRTATAVQLDEILTTLQRPDRQNLSGLLERLGSTLVDPPTPAEDRGHDPAVKGKPAAAALNETFRYLGPAGRDTAQTNQALLGEQAGDLHRLLDSTGVVFQKLASREAQLSSLISNFSITVGALAAESGALGETVAELAPTLEIAEPALTKLNDTLPPLRAFARELTPAIEELPATIEDGTPWLRQVRRLVQPEELGDIAKDLRGATPNLAAATADLAGLLPELQSTSRCLSRILVPTLDGVIADAFSTDSTNFNEFLYGAAGTSGVGANFDGNGQQLRVQFGGGPSFVTAPSPGAGSLQSPLAGYWIQAPTGTQPVRPASDPPIRTDFACERNELPDLNGPAAAVGPPAVVTP
jgi:ABC-type transporter Mla subunit MlaD